jgi:hypothetical protein
MGPGLPLIGGHRAAAGGTADTDLAGDRSDVCGWEPLAGATRVTCGERARTRSNAQVLMVCMIRTELDH